MILLFTFAMVAYAHSAPWPKLDTDRERLQYGLNLRAQTATFFTGTFNYGMEWWNIARDQHEISTAMQRLNLNSQDDRPMNLFTLNRRETKILVGPEEFERLKIQLGAFVDQRSAFSKSSLFEEIRAKFKLVSEGKSSDLLEQLMRVIDVPKDDFLMLQKGTTTDKILALKSFLPRDLGATSLAKNSKNKWNAERLGSSLEAVEFLEKLIRVENELPILISLAVLTSGAAATAGPAELKAIVSSVSFQSFTKWQDSRFLEANLERVPVESISHAAAPADWVKFVSKVFSRSMQKLAVLDPLSLEVETPYLQLVEKPRDEAIIRSAIGKDCTHTCAFAKADNPNQRIFYVLDLKENKEIGYVDAEIKRSQVGDVLYVSSINGPSIQPHQVDEIFQMFYRYRQQLGVQQVVVLKENLWLHMNYGDVIQHIEKMLVGKPVLTVHSKNARITELIQQFLKTDYQFEVANTKAVIYSDPYDMTSFVTHAEMKTNATLQKAEFSSRNITLFALELDATQRWQTEANHDSDGERAIKAANLNLVEYLNLRAVIQNRDRLKFAEFFQASSDALAKFGIKSDEIFRKEHPHLFYDGQLSAPDALEGNSAKPNLLLVADLIKRGIWQPTLGLQVLGQDPKNRDIVNKSRELQSVFSWGQHDLAFHSVQFRNMVLAGFGHPQLRDPEKTKALLRAVSSSSLWGPDLSAEILKIIYADELHVVLKKYAVDSDPQVQDGVFKMRDRFANKKMCSNLFH